MRDIKEPGASIHPDYVAYNLNLKNGEQLTGFVRAQDEHSFRITGADGKEIVVSRSTTTAFENAESMARSEIEDYITALGPYEFQELVAALLRGMGYYTPFVAPRGKDGGVGAMRLGLWTAARAVVLAGASMNARRLRRGPSGAGKKHICPRHFAGKT